LITTADSKSLDKYSRNIKKQLIELKEAVIEHLDTIFTESITVENRGAFVIYFYIEYTLKGKNFSNRSPDIRFLENRSLSIPGQASDIKLVIRMHTGIHYKDIFNKNYPKPITEKFKVSGTIFNPKVKQV